MDAFFANVEVLDDPRLRGKCVLIGRNEKRCVVSTASYEARKFGCHSAMPKNLIPYVGFDRIPAKKA